MLCFASICPHPPIIIPNIGRQQLKNVRNTIEAMEKLADDFVLSQPETIIIVSPHGPVQYNEMTIVNSEKLEGSFYNFGDLETQMSFKNDLETIRLIKNKAEENNIAVELIDRQNLDHGTLVPLYYLTKKYPNAKVIPIAFSFLNFQAHFEFGKIIAEQLSVSNKQYAIIASGDLSHRITFDAPAGYSPRGKEFDEKLISLLEKNDAKSILGLDPYLIEEAGECGLRSIIILLGALASLKYKFELLSYEAPFGVGYLVANMKLS